MNNTSVKVGDIIKSYDFPGRTDCYITGKVIKIIENESMLLAEVISAISEDKPYNFPDRIFKTALPGSCLFDDVFERIVIIPSGETV